jgi:hypothetical protein
MVKPFSKAAFSQAKLNTVHGPVKTDFGYHLIWLKDKTSAENTLANRKIQVAHAIKKQRDDEKVKVIRNQLDKFIADKAEDTKIRDFLKVNGFSILESASFDDKTRIDGVPFMVSQSALTAPIKEWQGPLELTNKLYMYRVNETLEPKQMDIKDARTRIIKRLEQEETEKLARDLSTQVKEGKISWSDLKRAGASLKHHAGISPYEISEIPDLGTSEILLRAVQELTAKSNVSAPLVYEDKWVIFKGSKFSRVPTKLPAKEEKRVRESLFSKKKAQILDSFVQSLVKEAQIPEDFRKKYNI